MREARPIRILRIIARLNIGGPARQALLLSETLNGGSFASRLVYGRPAPDEGDWSDRLNASASRIRLNRFGRELHPINDVATLWQLCRVVAEFRPDIIHTHTAKAGALGRLAGGLMNARWRWSHDRHRAVLVHTFHGHVLAGYFPQVMTRLFLGIERALARRTDRIIAVSPSVREELLRLGIGDAERVTVVRLGLPLDDLLAVEPPPAPARPCRVGIIGRLVPIKRHELFLQMAQRCRMEAPGTDWRFAVVGDGERRSELEGLAQRLGLHGTLTFTGWQSDLPAVYRGLDVVCLTSANEGTPVSLIEALAAHRAVVATEVGGVRDIVGPTVTRQEGIQIAERGLLIGHGDSAALSRAVQMLAAQDELRLRLGRAGRQFVQHHYSAEQLIHHLTQLYEELVP
ncbi:MAG: glycosyltransferase [Candidatus Omnitrophica bacterium]|nr:glycosyltransferase [Candidatus Omnitrophota bacterium]